MKIIRTPGILIAGLLAVAPWVSRADTFFSDNFSNGSTTNAESIPGGTATASSTSYDFASSKNSTASSISPGLLRGVLTGATSSGYWEAQALFTTNPVVLVQPGDYVDMTIVFTNSAGTLWVGDQSEVWIGLYDSGATAGTINPPVAGALADGGLNTTAGSEYATGNCQLWKGYAGRVRSGIGSYLEARPVQDGSGTTSANQELLGDGRSGGTYNNPGGTRLATATTPVITPDTNTAYTLEMHIELDPAGSGDLIVSNALYLGAGTGGTILMTNVATDSSPMTKSFDGLAFGAFNHNSPSQNPQMDVSSIQVTGQSTAVSAPPDITSQPVAVTAPVGSSVAFSVSSSGFNMTYQWQRDGTNLVDGGNISGAQSDQLIISPVGSGDFASSANGYSVTVFGAGGYSTNSDTVALSQGTAKNLTWAGPGADWDLDTSANWQNSGGSSSVFNYGDAVTFNGGQPTGITLSGNYLSASSVTVEGNTGYQFTGSGSFAGPGKLYFLGTFLDIANANTYTGGTVISNSQALLYLENYHGLGTGPITLAKAGGEMEVVPTGSGSLGIPGDINVADNFTISYDTAGSSYSLVFLGNLTGTAGKTLTVQLQGTPSTNLDRVRLYGGDTVYDGNLALGSSTLWAAYGNNQTYNGTISGNGAFMQKGDVSYLNGANTYSGGTYVPAGSLGFGRDTVGSPVTSGPIGTGPLYLKVDSSSHTTASSEVFASGGARNIANPVEYPTANDNLTLVISGTNDLTFSGPFDLQGQDGTSVYTNRILEVNNTGLTTISGVIGDGGMGFGLTQTGTGVLALNNNETYTGPTTISSGTMLVNDQLGAGDVTVEGGMLGGSGSISGPVTVQSGGTLSPGASNSVATLTINNNLTVSGNLVVDVNKSLAPGTTNDTINVTGTLSNMGTGTLTVNNLGPALAAGDTFKVFSQPLTGGDAMTVTGSGVVWNNNLATDGTISVAAVVIPKPVITSTTLLSGNGGLVFNGTNGMAGTSFYVLSTTNLALPLSQWTPVSTNMFDTSGNFSVTNPVSGTVPQTFYILQPAP